MDNQAVGDAMQNRQLLEQQAVEIDVLKVQVLQADVRAATLKQQLTAVEQRMQAVEVQLSLLMVTVGRSDVAAGGVTVGRSDVAAGDAAASSTGGPGRCDAAAGSGPWQAPPAVPPSMKAPPAMQPNQMVLWQQGWPQQVPPQQVPPQQVPLQQAPPPPPPPPLNLPVMRDGEYNWRHWQKLPPSAFPEIADMTGAPGKPDDGTPEIPREPWRVIWHDADGYECITCLLCNRNYNDWHHWEHWDSNGHKKAVAALPPRGHWQTKISNALINLPGWRVRKV
jgi:hypothetical protein